MPQATQFRRRRADLIFYLGVAPDGVYTDPVCHHTSGELLPRLFILTIRFKILSTLWYTFLNKSQMAVIFCCTFLKVTLTRRYLASLLYGARTFLSQFLSEFTSDYSMWSRVIIACFKLIVNEIFIFSIDLIVDMVQNNHIDKF